MKALIIKYTPREGSNTAKLVVEVEKILSPHYSIELVDLVKNPPEFFLANNLNAYVKKYLHEKEITPAEEKHLLKLEEYTDQLLRNDLIFLAYPIYNYNMPGAIRAWLDLIVVAGKTFHYTDYGPVGLLKGKKLIVINTTDSVKPFSSKDYSSPYIKEMASFIGIEEVKITGLFGIKYTGVTPEKLAEFIQDINSYLNITQL